MTAATPTPLRRALRTTDAARYLGVSPSLLRKMRARGPDDPLGTGPPYIKLSPSLIVYEITSLDSWLESRPAWTPFRGIHSAQVRDGGKTRGKEP
jgi:hypothetical protein